MSPQGLQAQATLQKVQSYDPKRDTPSKSLLRFLKGQVDKHLESGVLPENERRHFSAQFEPLISRHTTSAAARSASHASGLRRSAFAAR